MPKQQQQRRGKMKRPRKNRIGVLRHRRKDHACIGWVGDGYVKWIPRREKVGKKTTRHNVMGDSGLSANVEE